MSTVRPRELLSRRFDSPNQAWMTRHVSQRIGAVAAAAAHAGGLSPNAVTLTGLALALAGCVPFVLGDSPAHWAVAALLWQLAFALDCADGQLARATGRGSRYGAWLDVACDHVRQSALVVSVFAVLVTPLGPLASLVAAFLFASGLSAYLHTATLMHTLKPPDFSAAQAVSSLRTLLQTVLDAPVLLLLLCVTRPSASLLAGFSAVYGLLLLVRAAAIAGTRLRA
jgi:phosphatidylglycerophosphate synthase